MCPLLLFLSASVLSLASACNEAVCASIVSKCTLLKSCECSMIVNNFENNNLDTVDNSCSCCAECKKCLDYLFEECCSCVSLCLKPNVTLPGESESVVFDFEQPVPSLWDALTGMTINEDEDRWLSITYPVDINPSMVTFSSSLDKKIESSSDLDLVTVNCTVAFQSQRTSRSKCKKNCASMGATSGRWFENGCCECVGHNCQAYGIGESRCKYINDDLEEVDLLDQYTDEELDELIQELS